MSLRSFRWAVVLSTVLLTAVVGFAFLASAEIGSAYLMVVRPAGPELPMLTAAVSIPLLRIAPGDPHRRPVTRPWVALVWGLLLGAPSLVAAWSLRGRSLETSVARWIACLGIYVPLACGVILTILLGLALPLACM